MCSLSHAKHAAAISGDRTLENLKTAIEAMRNAAASAQCAATDHAPRPAGRRGGAREGASPSRTSGAEGTSRLFWHVHRFASAPVHDNAITGSQQRRQPSTQRRAAEQLRALARLHRLRVAFDTEGFPVIPGRYGQIEWFDGTDLAVYTDRLRLFAKLWAIPGVRRHQTGDTEMRAVFPPEALQLIAGAIKARRRRTLSPEEGRRRGFKPTHRATSGP
jgi:hypothetical protein